MDFQYASHLVYIFVNRILFHNTQYFNKMLIYLNKLLVREEEEDLMMTMLFVLGFTFPLGQTLDKIKQTQIPHFLISS